MARKRKSTKKTTTRRRRRGGVGALNANDTVMNIAGILGGVAIAGILQKTLLANKSEAIQSLVPLAAGIALPMFVKSKIGTTLGSGMIAFGGAKLLKKYANIGGVGEFDDMMSGLGVDTDSVTLIAGDDDFAMAGMDENGEEMGDLYALAGLE